MQLLKNSGFFAQAAMISFAGLIAPTQGLADDTFAHLSAYYAIDAHMPQTVDITSDAVANGIRRIDFSFTSFDDDVVPARMEIPERVDNPPLIILLHGLTQTKEQWWRQDDGPYSFPSHHRAALIDAGYAVLAIDARNHGTRRDETDFEDPGVYLYNAYFDTARKFIAETAIDVRAAINALDEIDGVNQDQIGVAGFSLGAFVGYLSMSVEPRIDAGLFMALPLLPVSEGQTASFTSPFAYAQGFETRPVGMIMGTDDQLYSRQGVEALEAKMTNPAEVMWIQSDHDFPADTAKMSVTFFDDNF